MHKYPKEYWREHWNKRKQKILNYLGNKCVKCGSIEQLEVDHIDPSEKIFSINRKCSFKNLKNELDKCQLLCNKCHIKKTISEKKPFTHGTLYAWMKLKCNCDICLKAKEIYCEQRNAKRRSTANIREPYKQPADHGTFAQYNRELKVKSNERKQNPRIR